MFVGSHDRANWLHMFDILVNPSHQEGLPTVVIEALMASCVVVATDVGGTKEITNKEDVILIPANDEEDCATALVQALEQYQDRAGLSLQFVRSRFSPETSLDQYRELCEVVVKKTDHGKGKW